jgi:hypothetical protein
VCLLPLCFPASRVEGRGRRRSGGARWSSMPLSIDCARTSAHNGSPPAARRTGRRPVAVPPLPAAAACTYGAHFLSFPAAHRFDWPHLASGLCSGPGIPGGRPACQAPPAPPYVPVPGGQPAYGVAPATICRPRPPASGTHRP